ncbi:MAG: zf-HC2 domain-containing protein [Thermoanaerobaculia bacterium]|nr:zf-HC2 domain-containing protein [Thermoanaerobaculia bacterium]
MARDRNPDAGRHGEVADLLAWHVNGTLGAAERERVEAHLEACADCRAQLDFWRRLAPSLAALDAAPVPHPARLRALLDSLDATPATAATRRGFAAWPPGLRWLVAAQTAALVALALALGSTSARPAGDFRTLSADAAVVAVAEPLRLRVVFDERASERELRALLVPLGAVLVGGPSPLGVYTLELPGVHEPAATLAALREQPLIRFVEPLAAAGGR